MAGIHDDDDDGDIWIGNAGMETNSKIFSPFKTAFPFKVTVANTKLPNIFVVITAVKGMCQYSYKSIHINGFK